MCLELSPAGVPELFAAFAKAQADMGDVVKGAENAAFKQGNKVSRYADLAAVVEAVRPALNKHGLSVIQAPGFDGERITVETLLTHQAGGWARSTLHLRPTATTPQAVGSALTYGRRYALLAICGVAPEDDDGNAASGEGQGGQRFEGRRDDPPDTADVRACFLEIDKADGPAALAAWGRSNSDRIGKLTERGRGAVRGHYEAVLARLKATPPADDDNPFEREAA